MATISEIRHPQGESTLTLHVAGDEFETQFTSDHEDVAQLNALDAEDEWQAALDYFSRQVFGDRAT